MDTWPAILHCIPSSAKMEHRFLGLSLVLFGSLSLFLIHLLHAFIACVMSSAPPAGLPLGKTFPLLHLLSYSHPSALCRSHPPPEGRALDTLTLCCTTACIISQHSKIALNSHMHPLSRRLRISKAMCIPLGQCLCTPTKGLHRPLSTGRDAATNLSPSTSHNSLGRQKRCHGVR